MGNGIVRQLKSAAGVPDMDIEATVEDFRATMIEVSNGIDDVKIWLQVLVLIESVRAEHEGAVLPTEVRELISEMRIET